MVEDEKDEMWVVVSEFYPANQNLLDEVEILRSFDTKYDIDGPKEGFENWQEAVDHARNLRWSSYWFEGWDELYERCDNRDKEKDADEDEEEELNSEPEPPWYSSDLKGYISDEEHVIRVVLLSDYNAEITRRDNVLQEDIFEIQGGCIIHTHRVLIFLPTSKLF